MVASASPTSQDETTSPAHQGPNVPALAGLLIGLIAVIFLLDTFTQRGIPVSALYAIPLILTYRLPSHWAPPFMALLCSLLTFLGYHLSPNAQDVPTWVSLLNRSAGIGMLAIIAYLLVRHQRMTKDLVKAAVMATEHDAIRQREALSRKRSDEIRDLYEQAPCGYHSLDRDGVIIAMNQTELDWLGYAREELIGKKRYIDLLTPSGAAAFQRNFPRFKTEGVVHDLEFDLIRKDGSRLPILLNARAVKNTDGDYVASRSTVIDITDRKQADEALRQSHHRLEEEVRERTAALHLANRRLEAELAQSQRTTTDLQRSEARFRQLVESLPQLICTCLPDGSCDYVSPQWARYTGLPLEEHMGDGWLRRLHPDDQQATLTQWHRQLAERSPFETECRIKAATGRYRWFHTQLTPIRDESGVLVKWLGTSTDIDDSKQAQELQARLGAIVESSSDAIFSKGLDGRVTTWNRSAELMFGYPADEMIGHSILTLVPQELRIEELLLIEQVKTGRRLQQYETTRRRKGGRSLEVSLTLSPITDDKGRVVGVSTIARDITARKRADELLEQQRTLLELSYEPIFAWDMDHGIVDWNRGCEQLYGYTKAEALGQASHLLLHTQLPCSLSDIHAALETTGSWTGEIRQRTKEGQEVLVESRWSLLQTNGRRLVLETNWDITERRRAEVLILKKNKDLETLLHVTSHDLKEPLRAIESFSLLLQERYAGRLDDKGRDFLIRIVRATQRLDQLLTDILNLSRAQRMDPPVEEVEADLLVQEVFRRLDTRIKETGAHLTVRSPLPRLRVNRTWAIQGIYNLVANALKFARPGAPPDIEIDTYREHGGEQAHAMGLVVRDRGPGVAPEQRERIFELFQRAVGREVDGTGAGLAIVRQVAERHGGRAWVAPREGGGSEFYITFALPQTHLTKVGP
ncbi:MAG: PAS domain S-box protein [Nitrospira sp.]|nr:MAG: PAS domain S-box protein [Nitrospira sp.]